MSMTEHETRRLVSRPGALACAALVVAGLAGCTAPGRRTDRYPAPIFDTRIATPARPVPPPVVAPPRATKPGIAGTTIIVDAGHGGKDPGALGAGPVNEKTVNLGVALALGRLLESRGANVVPTRSGDAFIELDDRAALADRIHADLFVSVHADAAGSADASGATVYIARNASVASQDAGLRIAEALGRAGIECRGVRRAGYRVLVGHSRPAVLVECGFLTNRNEARLLSTPAYQGRLAEAIAEGIAGHFGG